MKTKVRRWGNSLGLRIPARLASSHRITEGSDIEIIEDGSELRLRPLEPEGYTLSELLKGVTEENLHHEVLTDRPKGKELW